MEQENPTVPDKVCNSCNGTGRVALSWSARAILSHMPDNGEYTIADLARAVGMPSSSAKTANDELVANGYAKRDPDKRKVGNADVWLVVK
jgi:DNA-binding MarR family transcriptional regulator